MTIDKCCRTLESLFFCPEQAADTELLERLESASGLERILVTAPVMDKISYREQGAGLLIVAPQKTTALGDLVLPPDALVVVLENVEKPGNLGAVLRVADGAGAQALLVCGGGTDIFNPNVLRASRGAFFSMPTISASTDDILAFCDKNGLSTVATSPAGPGSWDTTDLTGSTAILLGAEDTGLTAELLGAIDTTVSVPMAGSGDSLNVATTAAVLLYEAVRQRRAHSKED